VAVCVGVKVMVGVKVGVGLSVTVAVSAGVSVGVGVSVMVGVGVGVGVSVLLGVNVGVAVAEGTPAETCGTPGNPRPPTINSAVATSIVRTASRRGAARATKSVRVARSKERLCPARATLPSRRQARNFM
jgi:hypothetical protein